MDSDIDSFDTFLLRLYGALEDGDQEEARKLVFSFALGWRDGTLPFVLQPTELTALPASEWEEVEIVDLVRGNSDLKDALGMV